MAKNKEPFKNISTVTFWRTMAFILLGAILFYHFYGSREVSPKTETGQSQLVENTQSISALEKTVLPSEGVELPITWGDLGRRMVADGVIDEAKFRSLFPEGFDSMEEKMLTGEVQERIVMTQENSRFILNILWAFGLANKNEILTDAEMTDPQYGGDASKFASTGGWTLANGDAMDHYSRHPYVTLTQKEQDVVDRVSAGIFRPCCGNSTHFPDCNHGMAMLGLLELMAGGAVSEEEMYKVALQVNSYWFPQTYLDLATYFEEQGTKWTQVDPKLVLGASYSSGQGYAQTRKQIKSLPSPASGGGGCSV